MHGAQLYNFKLLFDSFAPRNFNNRYNKKKEVMYVLSPRTMFYDNFYSCDHCVHNCSSQCRYRCHQPSTHTAPQSAQPLIVYHLQRIYGVLSFSYLFASRMLLPYFGVKYIFNGHNIAARNGIRNESWAENKKEKKKRSRREQCSYRTSKKLTAPICAKMHSEEWSHRAYTRQRNNKFINVCT